MKCFICNMLFVAIIQSMLWCEVEDQGDRLSVRFGPLNVLCGMGHVVIPYVQIKAYRPPFGDCERCGGYGVGKVNLCVSGGLRQHALCGLCCDQRPVIIEYRETQAVCTKHYGAIMIAMSARDHQDFMRMLDRKFGIVSNSSAII